MTMNMLASATSLSDRDLLERLPQLAANERTDMAELVAHLAALARRPDVYAAEGYGSLFGYCTRALSLSEDAACTRIAAASACRRFPRILDLLTSGELNLTAVRRIAPHLTGENVDSVLARAVNRTRPDIDALVAELAPQPVVTPSVRKVPVRQQAPDAWRATTMELQTSPAAAMPSAGAETPTDLGLVPSAAAAAPPFAAQRPAPRPVLRLSAPDRYRMQFTIGVEAHEKFRRVQALLRREIPSGDPGLIFERFVDLLLAAVERSKVGKVAKPGKRRGIRSETDELASDEAASRYIPDEVKRAVWERDGARCAFVSAGGHRCAERAYLEFHHVKPYALGGPSTVENIALRCRAHNQHEARLVFGARGVSHAGERPVASRF